MPTRDELANALRKADAAGAATDAKRLADAIRTMDAQSTSPAAPAPSASAPAPVGPRPAPFVPERDNAPGMAAMIRKDYQGVIPEQPRYFKRPSPVMLPDEQKALQAEKDREAQRVKDRKASAAAFGGGMDMMPTEDAGGNVRPGTDVDTDISKGIVTAPIQFGQGLGEGAANMANVGFAASTGAYNAGANLIDPKREQTQPYRLEFPKNELLEGPGASVTGMAPRIAGQIMSARVPLGKAMPGGGFGAEIAKDALATGLGTPQDAQRLSDMIPGNTPVIGGVADFLKTNPNDNAFTAFGKNAAEDLLIGGGAGAILRGGVKAVDAIGGRAPIVSTPTNAGGARPGPPGMLPPPAAAGAPPPTPFSPPAVVRPGQAGAPPASQAAPVGTSTGSLGEAEVWFNSLPMKTRESVLRTLESSGVKSRAEQFEIIRDLNSIPPDRNSQNAFIASSKWGERYPSLRENLMNMGGGFSSTNPRKPDGKVLGIFGGKADTAQAIMDTEGRKQIVSEGGFLERSAERNFGKPSAEAAQDLRDELTGLSKTYNNLLDPTKSRKFKDPAKIAALSKADDNLRAFMKQDWVSKRMPPSVKDRIMVDASEEIRDLGWTPDQIKIILAGKDGKVLAPLFEAHGPLDWSQAMWDHLADQYPKFAAHVLQSSYAKAARGMASGINAADNMGTIKQLHRMRGVGEDGASIPGSLLHTLEQTMPSPSFSPTGKGSYADTRLNWGDIKGAQEAMTVTERFKAAAQRGESLAEVVNEIAVMSPRQKDAALSQITSFVQDSMGNKVRNVNPDQVGKDAATAPNLTQIGNENFVQAIRKVFGERGDALATDIETARASTTFNTNINKRIGPNTTMKREDIDKSPEIYENPAGLEGGIIDKGVKQLAGMATVGSIISPANAPLLALLPLAKLAWNNYKKAKRLTNEERNLLTDFWFRSREAGVDPEAALRAPPMRPGPRGPSRLGYGANVALGAGAGGTIGYNTSGGDPGATAAGILAGAGLGAGRARQRYARNQSSLIKPSRPPGPPSATPPRPPVKNGFGSSSLDMSEPARMRRAREQGFDTSRVAHRGLSKAYDESGGGRRYQMFTSSESDAGEYGSNVVSAYLRKGNNLALDGGGRNFNSIPVDTLPDAVRAKLHPSVQGVARVDDVADAAQKAGYDSVTVNNVYDNAWGEVPTKPRARTQKDIDEDNALLAELGIEPTVIDDGAKADASPPKNYDPVTIDVVFDTKNIRSTDATFDPSQSGSSKLLAGMPAGTPDAALAIGGGAYGAANPVDWDGDGTITDEEKRQTVMSYGMGGLMTPSLARGALKGADALRLPKLPSAGGRRVSELDRLAGDRDFPNWSEFRGPDQSTFGGVNAKTADLKLKGIAEQMEKAGAGRDQIWKETGWFKGNDGKWRFEIDDTKAGFNAAIRREVENKGTTRVGKGPDGVALKTAFNHTEAGKAYPQYSWTQLKGEVRPGSSTGGGHRASPYRDDGPGSMKFRAPNLDEAREVVLHEGQHGVQAVEGFARGGAPDVSMIDDVDAIGKAYNETGQPWESLDPNTQDEILRSAARDRYHRLAGEVEARNVQTRRDFTPEERRAHPPWTTQDVPDDQQIVRYGSGEQLSFGGVNAKTADKKALAAAETMERSGSDRDRILQATGWFRGVDGNWKFEIPDNDLQVRPEAALRGKGVLNDFVSDADAGGAYPELASIPTKRGEGYYQPPEQFADEEVSFSGRGQKARSVIAHERQHAIQDMEGFATGESNSPTKFAFDAPYQAQWDAIVKEKREIMNAVDIGDLRKRQSKGERISPNEAPYLERFNELEAQQQPMMRDLLLSPEDTYRRSAGEVEARNVQKRLDMTPDERRRTPPWATQDTPDDKQVISVQRGGGRKSAPAQAGFSFGGKGPSKPPNTVKPQGPPAAPGMPGPISPRVLEDAAKAAKRLPPEARNRLRANAFSEDPAPAMQASGFDPNLFSFAQDARTPPPGKVQNAFNRVTGQPNANALELGLQKSIESVAGQRGRSALRVGNEDVPDLPFGMRMAMGERNATRAEQSNARRAYTRAEKADKLDTPKVQRVVAAEREARVAQDILDKARLDAFSTEDVGAIVREQMDAIAKAMNRAPPSTLGLPTKGQQVSDALDNVVFGAPPPGARSRPKAKDTTYSNDEAKDAAKLLFSKEYARVWDDIVSGRTPVESIKPGSKQHLVLAVAAIGGIGALGVTSAMLADRTGPMQEPQYPKPEDPRVYFDWGKQRGNRRFVENLQIRFNQIDPRYQLREDGQWADGGKTDKTIRFWQSENGFAPDGNLTEEQAALIEEQAIDALRAEPAGPRSGQSQNAGSRTVMPPAR